MIEQELCEKTRLLWHNHLLNPTQDSLDSLAGQFHPDAVVIGTGRHEFYSSLKEFQTGLGLELPEGEPIQFLVLEEEYRCLPLGRDAALVCGRLWVREQTGHKAVPVEMDTRFTVAYYRTQGAWRVAHIHHSMPYLDQLPGEYYPKSISQQAHEAMVRAERMAHLAEHDLMTGLLNHAVFFQRVEQALRDGKAGTFLVIDLDYFKCVNDNYGHLVGDDIICKLADTLRAAFPRDAILGRLGGDEFAVCELSGLSCPEVEQRVAAFQRDFQNYAKQFNPCPAGSISCSIGISSFGRQDDCRSLYDRTDQALYRVKQSGKGAYCWASKAGKGAKPPCSGDP